MSFSFFLLLSSSRRLHNNHNTVQTTHHLHHANCNHTNPGTASYYCGITHYYSRFVSKRNEVGAHISTMDTSYCTQVAPISRSLFFFVSFSFFFLLAITINLHRHRHPTHKVAIVQTVLCMLLLLPLFYTSECDPFKVGRKTCEIYANNTDFEKLTIANVGKLRTTLRRQATSTKTPNYMFLYFRCVSRSFLVFALRVPPLVTNYSN